MMWLLQAELKAEFRDHFYNITRIMDCVACDKCKLWGKLQVPKFLFFLIKIYWKVQKYLTTSESLFFFKQIVN
jgi:hypothetical protein